MKKYLLFIVFVISVLSLKQSVCSQTVVSDEKRKLISEIVSLTKMDRQMTDITDLILKSMETTYPSGFEAAVDRRTDLSPRQKENLKSKSIASYKAFSENFREHLAKDIDYKKYIDDAIHPLYDKFYTESELRDLVTFYSSSTGQKVLTSMPELLVESMKSAKEKLLPQVLKIVDQVLDDEYTKAGVKIAGKPKN